MRVNDLLGMELLTESLGKWLAFLKQVSPWSPSFINSFTTVGFRAFKNFGTSSDGNCNTELISAEQVSNVSNWEGFSPGSSVAPLQPVVDICPKDYEYGAGY